jgi:leucyl-tRNA synthetase
VHVETGRPVTVGRREVMSKSKKNVVVPSAIIDAYGADTARLFMLSDSPPERDLEWSDAGIEGAWRYINRLWRMVTEPAIPPAPAGAPRPPLAGSAERVHRLIHKTIAAVSRDLDILHFNKAVARVRELTNALDELDARDAGAPWVYREGLETAVRLAGPMMPHVGEELWQRLGHARLLADMPWPEADESLLEDESVSIAVQVNGKLRGTVQLPKDSDRRRAEEAALKLENVAKAVGDKPIRKVIVVPNRIVNVVV